MSTILFDKNSPLLPAVKQKVFNLCETLKGGQLTPWLWFNCRGVDVTDFYGKTIHIQGCLYGQAQALVFFAFIKPFLQDAVVKTLDETLETCRIRGLKPEEPYIRETAMLLEGYLIDPIYDYMADIDRRIRGKGTPKSVGRRDVTDEITEMEKFVDKCKDEMIHGIQAADLASRTATEKQGSGKAGRRKIGRPKTYTQATLKKMQAFHDKIYERDGDSKAAWNEVADTYGAASGDAVRIACQKLKKSTK